MVGKPARLAVLLLVLASPASAGEIRGQCDIRFLASSTLHDFDGAVRCLPFTANLEKDETGRSTIPLVQVEIPVDEMNTGNRSRDAQMRKMFGSDRFPRIRGTVQNIDVDAVRKASAEEKAEMNLTLRIRDAERTVRAEVTRLIEEGNGVRFDLDIPVSLKDFGLEPPSVLFFIRVRDAVRVKGNFRVDISSNE